MATSDAKWDTKGLEQILKKLKKLEEREVQYGFFASSRYNKKNNNLPVAQVAKWQEEGTRGGQGQGAIPPRPFFSSHVLRIHSIGDPVGARFMYRLKVVVSDTFNTGYRRASINDLGLALKEGLQQEILDWASPPNAPYTVREKGFNDPLVETGKMYDSVKFKVKGVGGENA